MSLNKAGFNAAANIHPETEKTISVNGDADYQAAETVGPVADKAAKRVLIIAYYFPPLSGSGVQRTLKLVKYLRAYNWEPVVLTTGDDYALEDPSLLKELPEGIEVIRINTPAVIGHDLRVMYLKWIRNLLDEGLFKFYRKLLNRSREGTELYNLPDAQALWACRAIDETGKKIDRTPFDLIYTTSGPYSDHMIGFYLKRLTGKPWVADFRDEWSYNPSAALEKGSQAFRLNYSIEKTVVETADSVVAVTPLSAENYARNFKLRPEKVACITNGYDE
jgi:glycosyltransferase involved in cell wall biosynthesis